MVLRPRTRPLLRRTVAVVAFGALLLPAVADAKARPKPPVITKVTPKTAAVGTKLTIQGKNFKRGKAKNSVLFRRDKGKALFVKADISTTKKLLVVVPKTLERYMVQKAGGAVPTRFRVRVLANKLSQRYTNNKRSPVIGPEHTASDDDGDCDGDGVKNGVDADDDNDLLSDTLELSLGLDRCVGDTDGDGVEDGFEYKSAVDLNNDDYQDPNSVVPYPKKTPYPNPLFDDANTDFDGDSLSLGTEYKLWKYTYDVNHTATRTLDPLSYSDGAQYSLSELENGNGRRVPTMRPADYTPPQNFRAWADVSGYGTLSLFSLDGLHTRASYDLFDFNRDGVVSDSERYYWDGTGYVSDDERDEDADGLTNYDEVNGPMTAGWWSSCYTEDGSYPIPYSGTKADDADSDGDGILDGADDQDFDDVPNVMELSRNMAGDWPVNGTCGGDATYDAAAPDTTYVNPFNPCLPDMYSRTCERHPKMAAGYAPFIAHWEPTIRN